ncbi:MAG: hypothetical protein WA734_19335 [Candidatus Acidiferrales bacterium]
MKSMTKLRNRVLHSWTRFGSAAAVAVAAALFAFTVFSKAAQDENGKGAGVYVGADANAKDVGLPIYPGARPHKDKNNDTPATKFGLWGGSFGLKIAVMKLESNDSPDKIAAFYKKALGKYGPVLNCSNASGSSSDDDKNESSKKIECGDDKPDAGGMLFKSGTKERQHIVGVTPNGMGSVFELVYVQVPESDKNK